MESVKGTSDCPPFGTQFSQLALGIHCFLIMKGVSYVHSSSFRGENR